MKSHSVFPLYVLYLAWCVGVSAFALGSFVHLVQEFLAVRYSYVHESVMVLGQVGFQWLFMSSSKWGNKIRYMFIALSVSMIGSVLLIPLLVWHGMYPVSPQGATVYFFGVVAIIFSIHHLLIVRNGLPRILSSTWIVYRLLLLAYVLIPRTLAH